MSKTKSLKNRPVIEKKDIEKEPAMIELKRMIKAGEIDQERLENYLKKEGD